MPIVTFPAKKLGESPVQIEDARSIVVVGANGSGKTRLGSFVEQQAAGKAHRISAQRSLMVPDFIQPRAYEQAEKTLLYGTYQPNWNDSQHISNKSGHRWGNQPFTMMLNDYEHVLALLFADEAKRDRDYARPATSTIPTSTAPKCKLDALAGIWAAVMPQRRLTISDDRVRASSPHGSSYEGRYMSDGERVAIYLMGQSLCAPEDGVVIVDEPEIHLHRAIQGLLWDQIEAARPDCAFVYITHDLDFAATRVGARRIWLRSFDGSAWSWDEIEDSTLPDALAMQILGTRRPILFVEGGDRSLDVSIYTALYPLEHVVSRASCAKVIEATKAMAELPVFHHLEVRGLIDRDHRSEEEIAALKEASVIVADVAEVENLLCIPEAIEAVARRLGLPPEARVASAQEKLLEELRKQCNYQVTSRALADIQFRLNGFGPKPAKADADRLGEDLAAHVSGMDVAAIVARSRSLFDDVLAKKDYMGALRIFNCKGNISFVASALDLPARVYVSTVLCILKEEPRGHIATAMRNLIGA